uniref:Uncharacterized protein n=1 Tax=Candidatus Kentrum sp. UNK TaxID=2126344 RepID=A0A451ASM3_9GAMM|nr:MAG: hypothetical protein BECKUNK1418G_GA0071005_100629 [Candidatus Kentron sp. UNK]VFK69021.1 MAG: hypothetical protein BECKUNK1418H_GA0071006_100921 [Candidatus Kentron sp. UNK]
MDRYSDMSSYARVRYRIFAGNGAMVLNLDNPMVAAMRSERSGLNGDNIRRIIGFTLSMPGSNEFGITDQGGDAWIIYEKTP